MQNPSVGQETSGPAVSAPDAVCKVADADHEAPFHREYWTTAPVFHTAMQLLVLEQEMEGY